MELGVYSGTGQKLKLPEKPAREKHSFLVAMKLAYFQHSEHSAIQRTKWEETVKVAKKISRAQERKISPPQGKGTCWGNSSIRVDSVGTERCLPSWAATKKKISRAQERKILAFQGTGVCGASAFEKGSALGLNAAF